MEPWVETPRLDRALFVLVPGAAASPLLWFALPGYAVDFGLRWVPLIAALTTAAAFVLLSRRLTVPRSHLLPRVALIGLASGCLLFTVLQLLNRYGDRAPPAIETVEVLAVSPPFGRYSGHTTFRRPGRPETYEIESGWHASVGKPMRIEFHAGLLGWAWLENE